jgi:GMP synthase PP-ATPase subunit
LKADIEDGTTPVCRGIKLVVYDITSELPGTIEWA